MRAIKHPLSGAIYDLQSDGTIRVEKDGKAGIFGADAPTFPAKSFLRTRSYAYGLADANYPRAIVRPWKPRRVEEASMNLGDSSKRNRSSGISYQRLLDTDTHPVPAIVLHAARGQT